jgi:hypothetical protein
MRKEDMMSTEVSLIAWRDGNSREVIRGQLSPVSFVGRKEVQYVQDSPHKTQSAH